MPAHTRSSEKHPLDPVAKPATSTNKAAKPIDVPWQALMPYPMDNAAFPLETPSLKKDAATPGDQATPKTPSFDPALLQAPLGNYADQGLLPPPIYERGTRDQRIAAYQLNLGASNFIASHLTSDETRGPYLESRLKALGDFTKSLDEPATATDAAQTVQTTQSKVPTKLIDETRPLIEKLESIPKPADKDAVSKNPEAAHVGTGTDWNTTLGVPQYRTQSDNLIPPEASCNLTSLAMSLERLGYGRDEAMAAIDTQLKSQYLEEQKKKLLKEKKDPSTLPAQEDVVLPEGYFEGQVKGYLKAVDGAASKPYQGIRGKDTSEKAWDQIAAQYKDNAQFEDTLDMLRYLTKAGDRTDLDTITPKLLEKLEPDADKRPTYRTITPGKNMDWTKARGQMTDVLDDGGAAMLSFHHKGGRNTAASHIVSVQQLTDEGLVVDDPYGKPRDDYRLRETGDAYGEKNQAGRSAARKNQVDTGTVSKTDATKVDSDWTAAKGQNLKANESLGSSATVPNDVYSSAWRSIRFLEPAKPKVKAETEAEPKT